MEWCAFHSDTSLPKLPEANKQMAEERHHMRQCQAHDLDFQKETQAAFKGLQWTNFFKPHLPPCGMFCQCMLWSVPVVKEHSEISPSC